MRLFTLLVFILLANCTYGQQLDQVYYRSVVDNMIKRSCSKIPVPKKEIQYEGDYIRIKTIGKLYNAKPPYRKVLFTLVEDHGESIKVTANGFCKVHLTLPISDIQVGRNYAILKGGNCESVLEYYYQDAVIKKAVIHACCEESNL